MQVIAWNTAILFTWTQLALAAPSNSFFLNKRVNHHTHTRRQLDLLQDKHQLQQGHKTAPTTARTTQAHTHAAQQAFQLEHLADLMDLHIPEEYGRITEVYDPPGVTPKSRRLILHLQDLHTHPEAQRNLVGILQFLRRYQNLPVVCVEGAGGKLQTDRLASFPMPGVRTQIASRFLEAGELTGEEYLALTTDPTLPIEGVEDATTYFTNLLAFHEVTAEHAESQRLVDQLTQALEDLRLHLWDQALLDLDRHRAAYAAGTLSPQDYLQVLHTAADQVHLDLEAHYPEVQRLQRLLLWEAQLEQAQVQTETAQLLARLSTTGPPNPAAHSQLEPVRLAATALEQGHISPKTFYRRLTEAADRLVPAWRTTYPQVATFRDSLDAAAQLDQAKLYTQLHQLYQDLQQRLAPTEEAWGLAEQLHRVVFLNRFINLRVTNDELEAYLADRAAYTITGFRAFLATHREPDTPDVDYHPPLLDDRLPLLEQFYTLAKARDESLVANTLRVLENYQTNRAVLIAGGFHTPGITQRLRAHGYSYVVVAPHVESELNYERYHQLLGGVSTSLPQLVAPLVPTAGLRLIGRTVQQAFTRNGQTVVATHSATYPHGVASTQRQIHRATTFVSMAAVALLTAGLYTAMQNGLDPEALLTWLHTSDIDVQVDLGEAAGQYAYVIRAEAAPSISIAHNVVAIGEQPIDSAGLTNLTTVNEDGRAIPSTWAALAEVPVEVAKDTPQAVNNLEAPHRMMAQTALLGWLFPRRSPAEPMDSRSSVDGTPVLDRRTFLGVIAGGLLIARMAAAVRGEPTRTKTAVEVDTSEVSTVEVLTFVQTHLQNRTHDHTPTFDQLRKSRTWKNALQETNPFEPDQYEQVAAAAAALIQEHTKALNERLGYFGLSLPWPVKPDLQRFVLRLLVRRIVMATAIEHMKQATDNPNQVIKAFVERLLVNAVLDQGETRYAMGILLRGERRRDRASGLPTALFPQLLAGDLWHEAMQLVPHKIAAASGKLVGLMGVRDDESLRSPLASVQASAELNNALNPYGYTTMFTLRELLGAHDDSLEVYRYSTTLRHNTRRYDIERYLLTSKDGDTYAADVMPVVAVGPFQSDFWGGVPDGWRNAAVRVHGKTLEHGTRMNALKYAHTPEDVKRLVLHHLQLTQDVVDSMPTSLRRQIETRISHELDKFQHLKQVVDVVFADLGDTEMFRLFPAIITTHEILHLRPGANTIELRDPNMLTIPEEETSLQPAIVIEMSTYLNQLALAEDPWFHLGHLVTNLWSKSDVVHQRAIEWVLKSLARRLSGYMSGKSQTQLIIMADTAKRLEASDGVHFLKTLKAGGMPLPELQQRIRQIAGEHYTTSFAIEGRPATLFDRLEQVEAPLDTSPSMLAMDEPPHDGHIRHTYKQLDRPKMSNQQPTRFMTSVTAVLLSGLAWYALALYGGGIEEAFGDSTSPTVALGLAATALSPPAVQTSLPYAATPLQLRWAPQGPMVEVDERHYLVSDKPAAAIEAYSRAIATTVERAITDNHDKQSTVLRVIPTSSGATAAGDGLMVVIAPDFDLPSQQDLARLLTTPHPVRFLDTPAFTRTQVRRHYGMATLDLPDGLFITHDELRQLHNTAVILLNADTLGGGRLPAWGPLADELQSRSTEKLIQHITILTVERTIAENLLTARDRLSRA